MNRHFAVSLVVALMSATACARQSQSGPARSLKNIITQEQIDSSNASNVYDLVARLHGEYLKDRGKISIKTNTHERAVVFMNDQEYGILETMRNIPVGRISEIRFYSGLEAVTKYGAQYGGGIVMLVSRTQ